MKSIVKKEIREWTMKYPSAPELDCTAPCSMYRVFLEHHLIPDLFLGITEQKLRRMSDSGCTFEAVFSVDEQILHRRYIDLLFEGLDTLCTIYLNEQKLDRVQNMHRSYRYEVKQLLLSGRNVIRLEFQSPTRYFERMHERHELYSNDGCTIPGAAHLRKAFFMSGWDWAPTLPDMGIWKPVQLIAYDSDCILDFDTRQIHRDGTADVTVSAEIRHPSGLPVYVSMDGQTAAIKNGAARFHFAHPRLWWVRGYGPQPLYDVRVWVEDPVSHEVLSEKRKKIGLRTLTVSTKPDPDGKGREFCFVNNGVRIFSMGANYVPQDSLLTRVGHAELDRMMQ